MAMTAAMTWGFLVVRSAPPLFVMPALVAGIHALRHQKQGVDGRDEPGHDDVEAPLVATIIEFIRR
jgi:hypothetical protein